MNDEVQKDLGGMIRWAILTTIRKHPNEDIYIEDVQATTNDILDELAARERITTRPLSSDLDTTCDRDTEITFEEPESAQNEKELLGFILVHEDAVLEFPEGSAFYNPDGPETVATTIRQALEESEAEFQNQVYKNIYDEYFRLTGSGLSHKETVTELKSSNDDPTAEIVTEITYEYPLTSRQLQEAVASQDEWLKHFVPEAIMAYYIKRLHIKQNRLTKEIATATPDRQREIISEIGMINNQIKAIRNKMGKQK